MGLFYSRNQKSSIRNDFKEVGGENAIKFDIYVTYNSLTHGTMSSVVVELTLERGTL